MEIDRIRLPFQEQIEFFRKKLNLPTERWDDILKAAHDRAFIVAGAMNADLLDDLRKAVDAGIAGGDTLADFRKKFKAIVQKHGWTGWTGEGTKAGEAWRTKVIYNTNISSSYAAGRWQQLNDHELLKVRPYWRYIHNDSVLSPRPHHKAWGDSGLTLPHDHPFWKTHFPPNGWGCRCRVKAVRGPGEGDATTPPEGWDTRTDKGLMPGIDAGWDYAPGENSETPLRQMVQDKLILYPEAITKALTRDVNRYINAHEPIADYASRVLDDRSKTPPLWLGFVENNEAVGAAAKRDVKGYMVLLPDGAPRHVERSHGNDGGNQRPATPQDFNHVLLVLNEADSLREGGLSEQGRPTVVAAKEIQGELFRCVFEVWPGKKSRALSLLSMVIKRYRQVGVDAALARPPTSTS